MVVLEHDNVARPTKVLLRDGPARQNRVRARRPGFAAWRRVEHPRQCFGPASIPRAHGQDFRLFCFLFHSVLRLIANFSAGGFEDRLRPVRKGQFELVLRDAGPDGLHLRD